MRKSSLNTLRKIALGASLAGFLQFCNVAFAEPPTYIFDPLPTPLKLPPATWKRCR